VNKMDLADYSEARFEAIKAEYTAFAARLDVHDVTFIPISALHGDNVVDRSTNMPWYQGSTLLYHLEHVHVASDHNLVDPRFPVQWVIRPQSDAHHDYRGYAGTVAGGVFRPGDEVVVLPAGLTTRVASIENMEGPLPEAFPPMSVTMRLTDDVDVSRGDMIAHVSNQPTVGQDLEAMVCWMSTRPLSARSTYLLKHTTRSVRTVVSGIKHRLDVNTLERDESATKLELNEIGCVKLRATSPLAYDPYMRNRDTGSFILIDEATNNTVAAGMLL